VGQAASVKVLERRELENYLLDPPAVTSLIEEKRKAAGLAGVQPTIGEVGDALCDDAQGLKEEVIRLRFQAASLKPIFLQGRNLEGSVEDRLARAVELLSQRMEGLPAVREHLVAEIDAEWNRTTASERAPGGLILDRVCQRYGVRFAKDNGDSARLARFVRREVVPDELRQLLTDVADVRA
jgi:hypothetical protein